jgi:hypothetical protein
MCENLISELWQGCLRNAILSDCHPGLAVSGWSPFGMTATVLELDRTLGHQVN